MKQQRQTEEAEAKRLAIESARREEARIRKEIEEKELEEARAMLAEAEKRKGKKGKKAAGDGVSSTWSLFTLESQMWIVLLQTYTSFEDISIFVDEYRDSID